MARIEVRLPAPEGVAADQTATLKLPMGRRYHEIQIAYTGVTLAQMTEIRIFVNGKVFHRYSATRRDEMNLFDGRTTANGILVIPFDRYKLKTLVGEEQTALNTSSPDANGNAINSAYIEIDIAAGATAPKLSFTATQSESVAGGAGTMLYVTRHTRDIAGAGSFDISDLPRGTVTSMMLNRIFFKPSANTISDVKVEKNQYTLFERSATLNSRIQSEGVRKPQSGYYVLDKTERGIGGDPIMLTGASDYRYMLNVTGAMAIDITTEYMGALGD